MLKDCCNYLVFKSYGTLNSSVIANRLGKYTISSKTINNKPTYFHRYVVGGDEKAKKVHLEYDTYNDKKGWLVGLKIVAYLLSLVIFKSIFYDALY